jgi:hypothetical protein
MCARSTSSAAAAFRGCAARSRVVRPSSVDGRIRGASEALPRRRFDSTLDLAGAPLSPPLSTHAAWQSTSVKPSKTTRGIFTTSASACDVKNSHDAINSAAPRQSCRKRRPVLCDTSCALLYQAAVRTGMGEGPIRWAAIRGTTAERDNNTGVVRAVAFSLHSRWVSSQGVLAPPQASPPSARGGRKRPESGPGSAGDSLPAMPGAEIAARDHGSRPSEWVRRVYPRDTRRRCWK